MRIISLLLNDINGKVDVIGVLNTLAENVIISENVLKNAELLIYTNLLQATGYYVGGAPGGTGGHLPPLTIAVWIIISDTKDKATRQKFLMKWREVMNEDLKERIKELLSKATVSIDIIFGSTIEEVAARKSEFKGMLYYWGCCFDKDENKWCTFSRWSLYSPKYYDSEREALLYLINELESDELFYYSRERFISKIKECESRFKLRVEKRINKPFLGHNSDLYSVSGYVKEGDFWETYYETFSSSGSPTDGFYRKEEDALYSMLKETAECKIYYMTKEEMKEEILKLRDKFQTMLITFKDLRGFPGICGCCFDEDSGKYVYYETDDRGDVCAGTTSVHEEFCIADMYDNILFKISSRKPNTQGKY